MPKEGNMKHYVLPLMLLIMLSPLGTMFWYDPLATNEQLELYVNLHGLGNDEKDVYVKAFVPDLDIQMASSAFDLDKNDNTLVYLNSLELADAQPGYYPVKVVAYNDEGVRDARYIWFTIE